MVAHHFHKLGAPLYIWNDRSLASISKAAAGIVAPTLPGILGAVFESSFESSSRVVLKPSGWDADIAASYKNIPAKYKGYMVVAKQSERSTGDGVISHRASLHKGVRQAEKNQGPLTGNKVVPDMTVFGNGHNMSRRSLISDQNPSQKGQDLFEAFASRLGK